MALLVVLAGSILLASVAVSSIAVVNLNDSVRQQVDRLDPARISAEDLLNALVNEETGVRGFILSSTRTFLQPYELGVAEESGALSNLRQDLRGDRRLTADVNRAAAAASTWREGYAVPTISRIAAGDTSARSVKATVKGGQMFDRFRSLMSTLASDLRRAHAAADARLTNADHELIGLLGLCLLALLGVFEVTWVLVRRWITSPIIEIATDVRAISNGAFEHPIAAGGSPELRSLAEDVDAMRRRILSDLDEVEEARRALALQTAALERSNSDLEQFAYVASHDLQEPLRKVASFSDLVVRRYSDDLDERGREFLGFIADGSRRMQRLINDVLELSRVGRTGRSFETVDLNDAFAVARSNLASAIEESGAVVSVKSLPTVIGDPALLSALFQNLLGNSLKFRSEQPVHVVVSASPDPEEAAWRIAVDDNGIGIEPQFAERIFAMFQRLHRRSDYPGTGIGLAVCRRIVEYHGGRIWLDTAHHPGASIVFTLPTASPRES